MNGLIADKEPEPVPGSSEIALHIKTSKPQANVWDWELYYDLDEALIANQEYTISVRMKASSAITFPFWPGKKDGTDTQYGAGTFSAGEQWSTNTFTFTPSADIDRLRFCFGLFGGDLYFDDCYLYFYYHPQDFIRKVDRLKEHLSPSGWDEFCRKHPDIIKIYQENDRDAFVIISYKFR